MFITVIFTLSDDLNSFQVGVNNIVSAVNSKAGTSLTESSTNEEIVEVINGIEVGGYSGTITVVVLIQTIAYGSDEASGHLRVQIYKGDTLVYDTGKFNCHNRVSNKTTTYNYNITV